MYSNCEMYTNMVTCCEIDQRARAKADINENMATYAKVKNLSVKESTQLVVTTPTGCWTPIACWKQ